MLAWCVYKYYYCLFLERQLEEGRDTKTAGLVCMERTQLRRCTWMNYRIYLLSVILELKIGAGRFF